MFASWNTPFWTPEMANLSCQCKKIKIRSWSFFRFYVVMEEKEEENNGEILKNWTPECLCFNLYVGQSTVLKKFTSTIQPVVTNQNVAFAHHTWTWEWVQKKYLQNLQNTKSPPSRRILGNTILFIISSVQISLFIEITFISSSNCSVLQ